MKPIMSRFISHEQFGFFEGRLIHEVVGSMQETINSIKQKHLASIIKLDNSKAYDMVSWVFLRLLLIHPGFSFPDVNQIMCGVNFVYF